MKTSVLTLLLILGLVPSAWASNLVSELSEQKRILEQLSPVVERLDRARLFMIRNSVDYVLQDIQGNLQAGRPQTTFPTLRLIQNLIVQYRFSNSFFGWTEPPAATSIYTESTAKSILRLKDLAIKLEKDFGLDDSPYTKITAQTFRQLQRILQALEAAAIDPELKKRLRSLWAPIGTTIAIAEQGDRPNAFKNAMPIVAQVRSLYPQFNRISSSAAGFSLVLELQGLTEFYAEFAQME